MQADTVSNLDVHATCLMKLSVQVYLLKKDEVLLN